MEFNVHNKYINRPRKDAPVNVILDYVMEQLSRFEFQEAEKYARLALQKDNKNTEIMDLLGEVLMGKGDFDRAKEVFMKSIQLNPNSGHSKYSNMGQLEQGVIAVKYYRQAVGVLLGEKQAIEEGRAQGNIKEVDAGIASALCSIAEIYMTDSCEDDNAENECQSILNEALKVDPNNCETLQVMASFKISQQKPDEALHYLTRSYETWKSLIEKANQADIGEDNEEREAEIATIYEGIPAYEFRIATAKLFLELQKPETAAEILKILTLEQDNIAEVWYLLGFAYSNNKDLAANVLHCCLTARDILVKTECDVPQIYEQVDALIAKAKTELQSRGIDPEQYQSHLVDLDVADGDDEDVNNDEEMEDVGDN
jgi:tetratricopeptide (TPR) repeat protein